MKNFKNFVIIILSLLSFFLFSIVCSQYANIFNGHKLDMKSLDAGQANVTNTWNPNTEKLDLSSTMDNHSVGLNHDVKMFYELLHKKDWKGTYEYRWKTFRRDIRETDYVNAAREEARKQGAIWELDNYEILTVNRYGDNNATLICKFVEMPGSGISYAAVDWHKEEDGV